MNWETTGKLLTATVSGAGITVTGLLVFGRDLLNKVIDARLKQEEIAYEHTFNERLASIQNELSSISRRQEIVFNALHTKRTEIIAELYKQIVLTCKAVAVLNAQKMLSTDPNPTVTKEQLTESLEHTLEKIGVLNEFIEINKIYLPEKLFNSLEKLQNVVDDGMHFALGEESGAKGFTRKDWAQLLNEEFSISMHVIEVWFTDMLAGEETKQVFFRNRENK